MPPAGSSTAPLPGTQTPAGTGGTAATNPNTANTADIAPAPITETRHQQISSLGCLAIGSKHDCISAYSQYGDGFLYTAITTYTHSSFPLVGSPVGAAPWGCGATFSCTDAASYAKGMTGKEIKAA